MSGVIQKNQSAITVKGSADIVCEYLGNYSNEKIEVRNY